MKKRINVVAVILLGEQFFKINDLKLGMIEYKDKVCSQSCENRELLHNRIST